MRTGLYVRISDDKEGSGLGVARQEGDCRKVVTEPNGWPVVEVYVGRAGALREAWPGFDVDRRHAMVSSIVERVDVKPGRRGLNQFEPGRFDIAWRF